MKLLRLILALGCLIPAYGQIPKEALQRNVGTNTVNGSLLSTPFQVATIAALKATVVTSIPDGTQVYVTGYYALGDGGQGYFQYSLASAATDNGGTVIAPTAGAGRWLRLLSNATLSVKLFGAKGDGTTDDTLAVKATIKAAENQTTINLNRVVYFPGGNVYLVTAPGTLSAYATTIGGGVTTGLIFRGDGMFNSVIRCNFGSGGWLFDNAVSGTELQQTQFEDLGFEGMNPASYTGFASLPTNVGAFKMTRGIYSSQGFIFKNCRFDLFAHAMEFDGGNNASEIKYSGCKFYRIGSAVYTINNAQSFNHEFVDTDIEQVYGDVFLVTTGGAIKYYGGSVIMFADGTSTDRWLFHMTGSSGTGAYPFTFNGLRCEFRGNYSNVSNISSTVQATVLFNDSMFELQSTVDKTSFCTLAAYGVTIFRGCVFYETNTGKMNFLCSSPNQYGQSGLIEFESCELNSDWSDRCSVSTFYGTIRAVDCHGSNIGAVTPPPNYYAWDFDLHCENGTPGTLANWPSSGSTLRAEISSASNNPRLKTVYLRTPVDLWTVTTTPQEYTLKLPRNAILKDIYFLKPGGGADANALTWKVGNNDKSTAHLTTASTANNVALQASTTNYFYNVGSTTNERQIRVWSSAGSPTATMQGGFVLVQYF